VTFVSSSLSSLSSFDHETASERLQQPKDSTHLCWTIDKPVRCQARLRLVACQMWRFSMPARKRPCLSLPYRRVCWQAMKDLPTLPIKPLAEPWILLSKYYHRNRQCYGSVCPFLSHPCFSLSSREFPFFSFCWSFQSHSFFYASSLGKRLSWLILASRSYRRILCFIALSDLLTRFQRQPPETLIRVSPIHTPLLFRTFSCRHRYSVCFLIFALIDIYSEDDGKSLDERCTCKRSICFPYKFHFTFHADWPERAIYFQTGLQEGQDNA
jgi:hypothetical protein